MDMSKMVTEGTGNIPEQSVLVLPNRVNAAIMHELEKALGGAGRVAWLVQNELPPEPAIMEHLQKTRASGLMFSTRRQTQAQVVERLRAFAAERRYIILLPGRPAQLRGTLSDYPAELLTFFDNSPIPVLPVFCGMFNDSPDDTICTSPPCDSTHLRILPPVKPGPAQSSRVLSAWLEASADLLNHHSIVETASLPHLLISALKTHPEACIIDGIDDSELTHHDLLVYAFRLSRLLKRHTTHRRLGIILPPGKLATIANVACILSGISPVNINFNAPAPVFREVVKKAGISRFITEERFVTKLQGFPWPPARDLIFIEQELADMSGSRLSLWRMLLRMLTPEQIAGRLHLPDTPTPDAEAALLFTSGSSGSVKGVPLTHRMLVANLVMSQSRIDLTTGDRFLSSLPIFHSFGLTIGMLMPLVYGYDMVTYPSPLAARRLCELIRRYKVRLTVATPTLVRHMFHLATPETFESLDYFITGAERLSPELAAEARQRFKLNLLEGYGLTEASPVVSVNLPAPIPLEGESAIPSARSGTVGAPLPGVAVRITDTSHEDRIQPLGTSGMIWLKGPSILKNYLDDEEATRERTHGAWFCTGDIGKLDTDGMLTILGRRTRFSKIGGEMISHEHVEQVLTRVLKIKPSAPGEPTRRIAVVGVPDSAKGEKLILLSTVHKISHPHDLITIRYGIMNEGYPALWCPDRILPVSSIPELANGKLNYPLCYNMAMKLLKK